MNERMIIIQKENSILARSFCVIRRRPLWALAAFDQERHR